MIYRWFSDTQHQYAEDYNDFINHGKVIKQEPRGVKV